MVKGIIALFTSGIIFNPMVLLGIIGGIAAIVRLDEESIRALMTNYHFYLLIAFISFGYIFVFQKEYKEGGIELNYAAMVFTAIWGIVKFFLAFILSMSFVVMISF